METHQNAAFRGVFDPSDGVVHLTFRMEGRANKINQVALEGLTAALDWSFALPGLRGVVLDSGHKDFCVGADLEMIQAERDPARVLEGVRVFHALHRRMETSPVPVVAVLTGSALGGGLELALACHRRVAVSDGRIQLGLPEVMLGVLPGGGGTQRLPRMIGLQAALELLTTGSLLRPDKARQKGLVDELAETPEAAVSTAKAWIAANPKVKQPWDRAGFTWPGGVQPGTPDARNLLLAASAMAYQRTAGAFPAVEAILSCVQEGSMIQFERALEVEGRHFVSLVVSDTAKDMIRTLFFHKQAVDRQEGLPRVDDPRLRKIGILGAGMMGAGLAVICAKAGYDVVLKDISAEALEKGMQHCRKEVGALKHLDEPARLQLLARITATLELEPLRGADLVIEAVVENLKVKHAVTRETEPWVAADGIWASNTSAIPIADLAKASGAADRFVGLHFFSPVEKMPLLEIIRGPATSDETVARCLAFGRTIKKTCILVNDGYGFYTSRTFSAYIVEGAQLVAEGHDPRLVEWAAKTAGMVVPPLQVFDEVSLNLGRHAIEQAAAYKGSQILEAPGVKLVFALAEAGRLGKVVGKGFYEYENGKRQGMWSGIGELVTREPAETGLALVRRRLMLAQVAEVGRCLDEGILTNLRDAEVGALLGIGFAPNTGGPLAFADRYGLANLVRDLDALAAEHGERFAPAGTFRRMASEGRRFFER